MYLAGLRIPDEDVRELITLVDEPTRSVLEKARALDSDVIALTIDDPPLGARRCTNGCVGRASRCAAPRARVAETRGARLIDLHIDAE